MQKLFVIGEFRDYYDYEDEYGNCNEKLNTDTLDELNEYLSNGWEVIEMKTVHTDDDATCYVLIENKSVCGKLKKISD